MTENICKNVLLTANEPKVTQGESYNDDECLKPVPIKTFKPGLAAALFFVPPQVATKSVNINTEEKQ